VPKSGFEGYLDRRRRCVSRNALSLVSVSSRMAYRSHLDDPEYWRGRAEELRALAEHSNFEDHILTMIEDYELLAESAAQKANRKQKPNPWPYLSPHDSRRPHFAHRIDMLDVEAIEPERASLIGRLGLDPVVQPFGLFG
jgi:hypothetical protein